MLEAAGITASTASRPQTHPACLHAGHSSQVPHCVWTPHQAPVQGQIHCQPTNVWLNGDVQVLVNYIHVHVQCFGKHFEIIFIESCV